MKIHSNNFKEQIKLNGKEIDSILTVGEVVLGNEDLNTATPSFQTSLLKSVMKQLDIDSNVEIPLNSILNYQFGVKVNGEYEYIDFGDYVVYKVEKQEDLRSYKILCYDKMLYTMKPYTTLQNGTFPMTVRDYIKNLCLDCGLVFKNANDVFANYDKAIESDIYADLGYTYRDIFDELSQVTASNICLDNNDQVEVRYITETNDVIDEEYLKDTNVNFGEKFGKVNSIVLSRSAESDNVYLRDESSVATNGLCEIKIVDNQIMNDNNRSDFLSAILEKLNGLEFFINDFVSTGVCYYDVCDKYGVQIGNNVYPCVMLNDEVLVTQGLQENIFTERPKESQTDYTKADKTDRKINQTYILVDKQNQKIELMVQKDDIINSINLSGEGILIEASKFSLKGKVIDLTGDSIVIQSNNFNVDENGNIIAYDASFRNVNIRGGSIVLEDDGTAEGSSIKIKTIQEYGEQLVVGMDLTSQKLLFSIDKNTVLPNPTELPGQALYNGYRGEANLIETSSGYKIKLTAFGYTIGQDTTISYTIDFLKNNLKVDSIYSRQLLNNQITSESLYFKEYEMPNDAGSITSLYDLTITGNIFLSQSITRTTNYNGYGIEADIIADFDFTEDDVNKVQQYILGQGTLTNTELVKYDVNKDGVVNSQDLLRIGKHIIHNISRSRPGKLKIDTQAIEDNIQLIDGDGNVKVSVDLAGIKIDGNSVSATNLIQMTLTGDITNFSNSYNHFFPFGSGGSAIETLEIGSKLTYESKTVSFGDRTNQTVWGVTVGSNVKAVEVKPCIRFLNNETTKGNISVYVDVVRNGTVKTAKLISETVPASARYVATFSYIVSHFGSENLTEGDFIFVRCYKSVEDIDVISSNNDSSIIFEVKS